MWKELAGEKSVLWHGLGFVLCFLVRLQGCVFRAYLQAKHHKWLGYCIWLSHIGKLFFFSNAQENCASY